MRVSTQPIKINDKEVEVLNYEEEMVTDEDTHVEHLKIKFTIQVIGESAQGEIYHLVRTPFNFTRNNGTLIRAELKHHSLMYKGDDLGEETPISYKLEIMELPLPIQVKEDNTNSLDQVVGELIEREAIDQVIEEMPVDVVALIELLIQKGVITEEEYLQQLSRVYDRQIK